MKKLTISHDEEITLTEREEEIYNIGYEAGRRHGINVGAFILSCVIAVIVICYLIAIYP